MFATWLSPSPEISGMNVITYSMQLDMTFKRIINIWFIVIWHFKTNLFQRALEVITCVCVGQSDKTLSLTGILYRLMGKSDPFLLEKKLFCFKESMKSFYLSLYQNIFALSKLKYKENVLIESEFVKVCGFPAEIIQPWSPFIVFKLK